MTEGKAAPGNSATVLVRIAIGLSIIEVMVVLVAMVLPLDQVTRQTVITTDVGVLTPIVASLIAASIQEVHLAVNSRLTELIEVNRQQATAAEHVRHTELEDK